MWLAATALSGLPLADVRADQPKWAPSVDVSGKAGETRRIGEVDLFLPIAQDDRNLLFLDLRTSFDNLDQREGNFGLGYRSMQDSGWNLGAYAFYDRRRSSEGHYFSQITTGLEALGQDFDGRINAYLPIGRKSYEVEDSARVDLSGGSVQILSGLERAYHGGDAELGWRVPVFAADQDTEMRVYGGGYWFDAESSESVAGPRGRLELRLYDPIEALPGSRVTFSGELQRDEARGTQHFLGLKLRIPLQAENTAHRLTPQERRMTDPLIRDVDIVTQSATISEKATLNGQTVASVTTITDGATAQSVIDGAASNTLLVVNGTTTVTSQLSLHQGQSLSSGGSTITLTGASSGRLVSFSTPGSVGTLRGAIAGNAVLALATDSKLSGLIVENTSTAANSYAVTANGISGATITGSRLTSANGAALWVNNSTATTVNTTTIRSTGAQSPAVLVQNASGNTFTDNTISATGARAAGLRLYQSSGTVSGNTISTTGNGDGTNNPYALWVDQGGGSILSGNIITATGQYGSTLYVDNSAAISISGNTLTASGYAGRGVQLFNSAGSTIANNTITTNDTTAGVSFDTTATGLFMESSANTTITGNTVVTKGDAAGMNLRHSNALTVTGNKITTTGGGGIALALTGSANSSVKTNILSTAGAAAHGVQVFINANNVTVEDNTITASGAGSSLVNLAVVDNIRIINNRLTGAGNAGVTTNTVTNLTISGNTP